MKKSLVLFFSIIAMCVIGFSSCVFAEGAYITTNATSQVELPPDVVDFDVEIITTSKDSMDKAIAENKNISSKVYENLKKITEKNTGDSLRTSSYSATSTYRYNNGKKIFECYQVTNKVKVHTKNIANVGSMIDKAMADGASSVSNISYNVSNYETECNKLLAEASKKAKEQAVSIAKSIGSEIIGVKSIEGSCSMSGQNNIMPRLMMAKAETYSADTESASTNIEVGTMTLNARVNANFYLK